MSRRDSDQNLSNVYYVISNSSGDGDNYTLDSSSGRLCIELYDGNELQSWLECSGYDIVNENHDCE